MKINSQRSLKVVSALIKCFIGILIGAVITINSAIALEKNATKPSNIIFILADDLGYGDIGVYGQKTIATPNIDQLAQEGIRFTNFYSGSTICAPSRSVLMTGKHLGHTRIRGNGQSDLALQPEDFTVTQLLKNAGYHTAVIGKWGLGDEGSTGIPAKKGVDYFYGFLNQVHAHNHFPAWLWRNNQKIYLKNKVVEFNVPYSPNFPASVTLPDGRKEYAGDLFFNESLNYIEQQAKTAQPFFLYLPIIAPHSNNDSHKYTLADGSKMHGMEVPNYGSYANTDWPAPQKGLAAMIEHVDNGVGAIINKLKALGVADNTLVIFTSDNGPHQSGGNLVEYFNSNGELRGKKRDLYEGGIRVPMIAWSPAHIAKNQVTDHIAYFGDFMATAADIAQVMPPKNLDSISFYPTLIHVDLSSIATKTKANTKQWPKPQQQSAHLYWEFYERGSAQAVRKGKWKAVRKPMFTGDIELYDLSNDISEANNIAKQYPDVVRDIDNIMKAEHVHDDNWQIKKRKKSQKH